MLEKSLFRLDEISPDLRHLAESMAAATMTSGLTEDLIPPARATEIADEHRSANTEAWQRATSAAIAALSALLKLGYKLERPS